jgi:hypothetical protein
MAAIDDVRARSIGVGAEFLERREVDVRLRCRAAQQVAHAAPSRRPER